MPVAFTPEKQQFIRQSLRDTALLLVKEFSVRNIKVEELTHAAGISKGAFYKFYPSKEALFYELLRELHNDIFSEPLALLFDTSYDNPADALCDSMIACYKALDTCDYKRFLLEDSLEIMNIVSESEKQAQHLAEEDLFFQFLSRFGSLAVSRELAFDAIRTLIATIYSQSALNSYYETILRWMAQGVCDRLFI